jgi:hypothetical protein
MMVYVSAHSVKKNLKNFGFHTYDNQVVSFFNESLYNFMLNSIKKHSAKGGRVLLPPEYFGVDSAKYIDTPTHTNMNISTEFIRPPMTMTTGGGSGATAKINISKSAVNGAASEAANRLGFSQWSQKGNSLNRMQEKYENMMTNMMKQVMKKSQGKDHLDFSTLESVAKTRKYNLLH